MEEKSSGKFLIFVQYILYVILISTLYCHGPDQVDHNFYLFFEDERLILRWEIPVGEILGYIQRHKMDSNKDNIVSQEEQNIFLKQFTDEHLKDLILLINNKKDRWKYLKTDVEIGTEKVIPAQMLIKIYIEVDKFELSGKFITIYLEDRADMNLTQFINFYTDNSINNPVISKDLFNGEERIFNITFEISKQTQEMVTQTQSQSRPSNQQKILGFYDKIKEYLATEKISLFTLISLLIFAFILGALHALEPGHGKSIMTAYILATHGTVLDIFLLGIVVVFTHTIVVYLLAFIALYLSQYILPQTLYPYLGFISSSLIIMLGLSLIKRSSTKSGNSNIHDHHFVENSSKWSNLIQFGISGGLIPCPAAIAILLTTIQLNKLILGILLILALSAGIATTLIFVGIVSFYSKRFIFGHDEISLSKYAIILPLFSGIFITTLGAIMLLKIFEDLKLFKVTLLF